MNKESKSVAEMMSEHITGAHQATKRIKMLLFLIFVSNETVLANGAQTPEEHLFKYIRKDVDIESSVDRYDAPDWFYIFEASKKVVFYANPSISPNNAGRAMGIGLSEVFSSQFEFFPGKRISSWLAEDKFLIGEVDYSFNQLGIDVVDFDTLANTVSRTKFYRGDFNIKFAKNARFLYKDYFQGEYFFVIFEKIQRFDLTKIGSLVDSEKVELFEAVECGTGSYSVILPDFHPEQIYGNEYLDESERNLRYLVGFTQCGNSFKLIDLKVKNRKTELTVQTEALYELDRGEVKAKRALVFGEARPGFIGTEFEGLLIPYQEGDKFFVRGVEANKVFKTFNDLGDVEMPVDSSPKFLSHVRHSVYALIFVQNTKNHRILFFYMMLEIDPIEGKVVKKLDSITYKDAFSPNKFLDAGKEVTDEFFHAEHRLNVMRFFSRDKKSVYTGHWWKDDRFCGARGCSPCTFTSFVPDDKPGKSLFYYSCSGCEGSGFDLVGEKCVQRADKCQVLNCQTCENSETTKCSVCGQGYFVEEKTKECFPRSSLCLLEVKKCSFCNLNTPEDCSGCQKGYELLDPKTCRLKCGDGMVEKTSTNTCEKCSEVVPNCENCDQKALGGCLRCKDGYFWDSSKSQCLERKCQNHQEFYDYRIEKEEERCRRCDSRPGLPGCNECELQDQTTQLTCLRCKEGFDIKTGCAECYLEFFLNSSSLCQKKCPEKIPWIPPNHCGECQTNCLSCRNSTLECLECQEGYFQNNTGQCQKKCPDLIPWIPPNSCGRCPENCIGCKNTTLECSECSKDFFLNRSSECQKKCPEGSAWVSPNNCSPCPENCTRCSNQTLECLECQKDFVIKSSDQGLRCSPAPEGPLSIVNIFFDKSTASSKIFFSKSIKTRNFDKILKTEYYQMNTYGEESFHKLTKGVNSTSISIGERSHSSNFLELKSVFEVNEFKGFIRVLNTSKNNIQAQSEDGDPIQSFFNQDSLTIPNIDYYVDKNFVETFRSNKTRIQVFGISLTTLFLIFSPAFAVIFLKVLQVYEIFRFINVELPSNAFSMLTLYDFILIDLLPTLYRYDESGLGCVLHKMVLMNEKYCLMMNNGFISFIPQFFFYFELKLIARYFGNSRGASKASSGTEKSFGEVNGVKRGGGGLVGSRRNLSEMRRDREAELSQKKEKGSEKGGKKKSFLRRFWRSVDRKGGFAFLCGTVNAIQVELFLSIFINLRHYRLVVKNWIMLGNLAACVALIVFYAFFMTKQFKKVKILMKIKDPKRGNRVASIAPLTKPRDPFCLENEPNLPQNGRERSEINFREEGKIGLKKWSFLIENLNPDTTGLAQYFNCFLTLKDFIFCLAIIPFLDYPLVQILVPLAYNIFLLIILVSSRPFSSRNQALIAFFNLCSEIVTLVLFGVALLIKNKEEKMKYRVVGWGFVVSSLLIYVAFGIVCFLETKAKLVEKFKWIKKKIFKKKPRDKNRTQMNGEERSNRLFPKKTKGKGGSNIPEGSSESRRLDFYEQESNLAIFSQNQRQNKIPWEDGPSAIQKEEKERTRQDHPAQERDPNLEDLRLQKVIKNLKRKEMKYKGRKKRKQFKNQSFSSNRNPLIIGRKLFQKKNRFRKYKKKKSGGKDNQINWNSEQISNRTNQQPKNLTKKPEGEIFEGNRLNANAESGYCYEQKEIDLNFASFLPQRIQSQDVKKNLGALKNNL